MHRRGPWSAHEDSHLLQLVQRLGPNNWVRISQLVSSRSPKQCRERYHQNLKPNLNHDPITPEEGIIIEKLVQEMGKRWAEIARQLNGRSDNAVKNWWNGGVNRRRRLNHREAPRARLQQSGMHSPVSYEHSTPYTQLAPIDPALSMMPRRDPLPSPPLFRCYSRDRTPSMISDSSSNAPISPRMPASPAPENTLPPLYNYSLENRTSLPPLHSVPQTPVQVYEHNYPQHSYHYSPSEDYSYKRAEYSYPQPQYQLPISPEPTPRNSISFGKPKDERMDLRSLCA
ncbi:hypothetical protein BJ508DRAFT_234325 [Ascobolus immersus RN42]|uniref:Trichome differentiation protein GL1 n=1 Tax=Ascobolus immersus RN42 TaxID=1160509 RepID=A0A3N4IJR3_ASCIM|nr:hypothetical protein BJ508DRAFT_234325 [Ascobolus immersus RN42]